MIKDLERRKLQAEIHYPALVTTGKMNNWTARHRLTCLETVVRLLKKHKKNPQLNLNDIFEEIKTPLVVPMPAGPADQPVDDPDLYFTPEL